MQTTAIQVEEVTHRYGQRVALSSVSLEIARGEIFAFLGPNGSGKTTLFRLLSTLVPIQKGRIHVLGHDVRSQTQEVRTAIGVVFQAPSLDRKLTVGENIRHQGRLYGLAGRELRQRQDELLAQLGLEKRERDLVETLSGGLRRRVELAKALLHRPQVLLMDEPSTGLDPGARNDVWEILRRMRDEAGVTIALTTHLLDEADRAGRIAILDRGQIVALDTPDALRATVGGDSITIQTDDPNGLAAMISERFEVPAKAFDGRVRLEQPDGHQWIPRLVQAFGERITAITLAGPTLEDVFIDRTGHHFHPWEGEAPAEP